MKLRDLYAIISGGKEEKTTPGRESILHRADPVIQEFEQTMSDCQHIRIRVFESGYVLYEEDKRSTVFHIRRAIMNTFDNDKAKIWDLDQEEKSITRELLLDTDWEVGLILYGNSRIMSNRYKREEDTVFSYHCFSEEHPALSYNGSFFEEEEREYMQRKMREVFTRLMDAMTPKMWTIYVLVERDGKTQADIAREGGVRIQSVNEEYKEACRRVFELKKIMKEMYFEN